MSRVDHEKLIRFVSAPLRNSACRTATPRLRRRVLVAADLRGVDTHGVIRFNPDSWYVKWLRTAK